MPEESNNIINEHKENPKETKIYSKEQKLKELLIEGISEEYHGVGRKIIPDGKTEMQEVVSNNTDKYMGKCK